MPHNVCSSPETHPCLSWESSDVTTTIAADIGEPSLPRCAVSALTVEWILPIYASAQRRDLTTRTRCDVRHGTNASSANRIHPAPTDLQHRIDEGVPTARRCVRTGRGRGSGSRALRRTRCRRPPGVVSAARAGQELGRGLVAVAIPRMEAQPAPQGLGHTAIIVSHQVCRHAPLESGGPSRRGPVGHG
jgi:hypothetical protein